MGGAWGGAHPLGTREEQSGGCSTIDHGRNGAGNNLFEDFNLGHPVPACPGVSKPLRSSDTSLPGGPGFPRRAGPAAGARDKCESAKMSVTSEGQMRDLGLVAARPHTGNQVQLVYDQNEVDGQEHGNYVAHAESCAEEVVVLEDQEQRKAENCQQVLAEKERKDSALQQVAHQGVNLGTTGSDQPGCEYSIGYGRSHQGHDEREHQGGESIDVVDAPMLVGATSSHALARGRQGIPWTGGLFPPVRKLASICARFQIHGRQSTLS